MSDNVAYTEQSKQTYRAGRNDMVCGGVPTCILTPRKLAPFDKRTSVTGAEIGTKEQSVGVMIDMLSTFSLSQRRMRKAASVTITETEA
jgi:hypothetical protein